MLTRRPSNCRTPFARVNAPSDAEFAEEIKRPVDRGQAKFWALDPTSLEDLGRVQPTLYRAERGQNSLPLTRQSKTGGAQFVGRQAYVHYSSPRVFRSTVVEALLENLSL